jgi:hypothetical protein
MKVILQKEITLDTAMINGFKTYRNGCNFILRKKQDGTYWLEYGCYCLINLLTGEARLLRNFLKETKIEEPSRRIDNLVEPETINILLSREPCQCCGGFLFEKQE